MYDTYRYLFMMMMVWMSAWAHSSTSTNNGIPIGVFDWPAVGGEGYLMTRITDKGNLLEAAASNNIRVLISMKGSRKLYSDSLGCFDFEKWRARFDLEAIDRIRHFYDKGVIIGFYGPDEPHDWICGPTYKDLENICEYVDRHIPGLPCGYNVPALWLKGKRDQAGVTGPSHIRFILMQGNFRKVKDWRRWAEMKVREAQWFEGKLFLSVNALMDSPSTDDLVRAVEGLCQAKPDAVFIWKWEYIAKHDISRAVKYCQAINKRL